MKVWKQVDANDAHYLEQGSVKLGTWEDYRRLENGRGDPYDGAIVVHSGAFHNHEPGAAYALRRLGKSEAEVKWYARPNVRGVMIHNRTIFESPPRYVLCFSEVGCEYDPSPGKPKAMFEVADVAALAARLVDLHPEQLGPFDFGSVVYRKVEFQAQGNELIEDPQPFVKGLKFAVEREVRIVWQPARGGRINTLCTKPDEQVAQLFSRL